MVCCALTSGMDINITAAHHHAMVLHATALTCTDTTHTPAGVINAGFLLHAALQQAVLTWIPFLKPFLKNSVSFKPGEASAARATTTKTTGTTGAHHSLSQSPHHKRLQSLACAVTTTAVWGTAAVIGAAVVAAPLLLHQAHASASFCTHAQHQHTICGHCPAAVRAAVTAIWGPGVDVGATANTGNIDSGAMGGLVGKYHRPWCTDSPWKLSAYGFVQRQYWGVGFMEYWTLQQVSATCCATYATYTHMPCPPRANAHAPSLYTMLLYAMRAVTFLPALLLSLVVRLCHQSC